MSKVLLVTAGLLLVPLPALSQGASDSDDRGGAYGRRDRDLRELLRGLEGDMRGDAPRRGAGFLLRSGDATIAVRCDPRESMRTCVDLTTTLLERARASLPGGGGGPGGGPGGTPGAPPRP